MELKTWEQSIDYIDKLNKTRTLISSVSITLFCALLSALFYILTSLMVFIIVTVVIGLFYIYMMIVMFYDLDFAKKYNALFKKKDYTSCLNLIDERLKRKFIVNQTLKNYQKAAIYMNLGEINKAMAIFEGNPTYDRYRMSYLHAEIICLLYLDKYVEAKRNYVRYLAYFNKPSNNYILEMRKLVLKTLFDKIEEGLETNLNREDLFMEFPRLEEDIYSKKHIENKLEFNPEEKENLVKSIKKNNLNFFFSIFSLLTSVILLIVITVLGRMDADIDCTTSIIKYSYLGFVILGINILLLAYLLIAHSKDKRIKIGSSVAISSIFIIIGLTLGISSFGIHSNQEDYSLLKSAATNYSFKVPTSGRGIYDHQEILNRGNKYSVDTYYAYFPNQSEQEEMSSYLSSYTLASNTNLKDYPVTMKYVSTSPIEFTHYQLINGTSNTYLAYSTSKYWLKVVITDAPVNLI